MSKRDELAQELAAAYNLEIAAIRKDETGIKPKGFCYECDAPISYGLFCKPVVGAEEYSCEATYAQRIRFARVNFKANYR